MISKKSKKKKLTINFILLSSLRNMIEEFMKAHFRRPIKVSAISHTRKNSKMKFKCTLQDLYTQYK